MNQKETFEAVRSLARSRTKIVGLDRLVEDYLQRRKGLMDQETVHVMETVKLVIFDVSADLEKSYNQFNRKN